ncbi:hypothetical protein [Mycobacteroides franklinii]
MAFEYVLALHPMSNEMLKVQISDGSSTVLVSDLDSGPDGICVDPTRTYVYWTNMGKPRLPDRRPPTSDADLDFYRQNGSLERAGLDGSGRTEILPEGSFVTGKQLAGAWGRERLYWSDREGAAVRSARVDGTDMRDEVVVATTAVGRRDLLNQCVGVAVDEVNGYLYWTQKGPPKGGMGRIFRTPLDGVPGSRVIEVLWSNLPEPIDLEIDVVDGLLYWTDRGAPPLGNTLNRAEIPAAGKPGGDITVVSQGYREAIGLAVDKGAGVAYVGDLSGAIRAVKLDGTGEHVIFTAPGFLTGIAGV